MERLIVRLPSVHLSSKSQCGNDAELRAEVEKLIFGSDDGNSFLESPIWSEDVFLQTTLRNEVASSLEENIPAHARRRSG